MNLFFKDELLIRKLFDQYGGILHDYFSDNLSRIGSLESKEKMDKSVEIISKNTDKLLELKIKERYIPFAKYMGPQLTNEQANYYMNKMDSYFRFRGQNFTF